MKRSLIVALTIAVGSYACKPEPPHKPKTLSADLAKGEAFFGSQPDSSFYYFNRFVNTPGDSAELAYAYNCMGIIQEEAGDFFGSQESLAEALKFLNEDSVSDYYSLSSVYTMLGNTSIALKNFDAAIIYCNQGEKFAPDTNMLLYAANSKAVAYQKKNNFDAAINIYLFIISKSIGNKIEYARILSNLARARWLRDSNYPAQPELIRSMIIRRENNDSWGLNASYAHLSDYYAQGRPDSALHYARKMFEVATLNNSPGDKAEALQKLITLSPDKEAKRHFDLYQRLSDSIQTARNSAKNQFALIRFESEKSKTEKLKFQKESAEKTVRLIWHQVIFFVVMVILAFGIAAIISRNRKRKKQMEREKEEAIRDSEFRWSKKVHDGVANRLYSLMKSIEHNVAIDLRQIQDSLESIYEQSRDISHEFPANHAGGFQEAIAALLTDFSDANTKVSLVGNTNEFWNRVPPGTKKELEHVLLELMVNMRKHSSASNVAVKFEQNADQIEITYQDNGIGLATPLIYGNGLRNTESRIQKLAGQVIFEQAPSKGLKVRISFPIQPQHD